jgi:hypothetical protein
MGSRNSLRAATSGIFLLFLALAFLVSQANGELFLPILFVGLAITALIGSLSIANPRGVYGGLYGFVWCLGLAFCFLFGFWPWILFVVAGSMILGAFAQPIMAALMGMSFLTMFNGLNTQPQQSYQAPPPQQDPYQQQPYQQGYPSPPPAPERYQEGGKQYTTPPSAEYDQPQSQYPPQELPPQ